MTTRIEFGAARREGVRMVKGKNDFDVIERALRAERFGTFEKRGTGDRE